MMRAEREGDEGRREGVMRGGESEGNEGRREGE